MKLKRIAAAAALVASAAPAFAVGPGNLGAIDNSVVMVSNMTSGVFVDTYTFSLAGMGDVFGAANAYTAGTFLNTIGFQAQLLGPGFTVLGTDTNPADGFSFTGLSAGTYALQFAGFANGSGPDGYTGYIAAVPEPETYAMMLAGLAAVGFMASRRRKG